MKGMLLRAPSPALAAVTARQGAATLMRSVNTADSNKGRQKSSVKRRRRRARGAKHNKAKKGRSSSLFKSHWVLSSMRDQKSIK